MAPQETEVENVYDPARERDLLSGEKLAHPTPGEEVIITGMAGRFPDSDDMYHFRDNLLNKRDLVSDDDRRWKLCQPEIPHRTGKINFVEKFDAGFFGMHYRQAHMMDPMCRQLLERSFECIVDAGYHPEELRGTNTGVFIGACFSETEKCWFYDVFESPNYGVTGCIRSTLANRISYFFGLEGPSYVLDTACSSSMYALEHAYRAIRLGHCDQAIVGGANLCLHPMVSLQFARLGVLSADGSCKSFDADANGYARSETVATVFLQKSKDARRIYARIIHGKTNCDGYKEQGITFPSGPMQQQLLSEFYEECKVDPSSIEFLEAHATGTKVGDPEEISAMDYIFCTNRKEPLYVGSIKSNLGHTEPASGLCSLAKVILGMEMGLIMPNINYTRPREGAEPLEKGRMVVVTEKTPIPEGSGYTAINSFGFGGANGHVLLQRNMRKKLDDGQPRDDLPRLVCVSGRTENAIYALLDDLKSRKLDAEYVRLFHQVFSRGIPGHVYRGYSLVGKEGEVLRSLASYHKTEPLQIIFGEADRHFLNVGQQLFVLPLFAASIQRIHNILAHTGVNIIELINNPEDVTNVKNIILGSVAVQLSLVDLFKTIEVEVTHVIGYSVGLIAAAYFDQVLSLEQSILSAFHLTQAIGTMNGPKTASYHVSLSRQELEPLLPSAVEITMSGSACVVSGPLNQFDGLIEKFNQLGVAHKQIEDFGIHSKRFNSVASNLLKQLKDVAPVKIQAKRLVGVDVEKSWPETFVHLLSQSVAFDVNTKNLAHYTSTLFIEISSTAHVREDRNVHAVQFPSNDEHLNQLLSVFGRIYEAGHNPQLDRIYPKVQYPVSCGTPMLSPLIKWNHETDWHVTLYKVQDKIKGGERVIAFNIRETEWCFLAGHVIDGRMLFPATGYIELVWETYSIMLGLLISDMRVVLENVRFHRATHIPRDGSVGLLVLIQKGSGEFEVVEGGAAVVTGRIYVPDNFQDEVSNIPIPTGLENDDEVPLTTKDIYKELKLRGYNYSGAFRKMVKCDLNATKGLVEWDGNWISFMDNMLQIKILQEDNRNLFVPTGIDKLTIDSKYHIRCAQQLGENPVNLPVYVCKESGIVRSGGIEVRGLQASSIPRRKLLGEPVLESHKFIPNEAVLNREDAVRVNTQIALENSTGLKVRVVELVDEFTKTPADVLGTLVHQSFSDQPLIQPEVVVLCKEALELQNVTVEDKKLTSETNCSLVIATHLLERHEVLQQAFAALKDGGYLVSRENLDCDVLGLQEERSVNVLTIFTTDTEKLVFIRKPLPVKEGETPATPVVLKITDADSAYEWIPKLQEILKNNQKVILVAQNETLNGLMGFANCLRRETGGENVRMVFIFGGAPEFDLDHPFYAKQLKKELSINIYKDQQWGTYRHLLLPQNPLVEVEHGFVNTLVRGDLSSLSWVEGPLSTNCVLDLEQTLVYVYNSAVNFRDIMIASGRISGDLFTRDRLIEESLQGFEFSGRDKTGRRVMGMIPYNALSSLVAADSYLLMPIPDEWSMEDAATVCVVYGTALTAFLLVGELKPGMSVLIHAGSGGVGQAAINVALYFKCTVFTTVGTQEKRDFIRAQFPSIPDTHIGNSRDTSFEQMVMTYTGGRGVDFVLNSLAEDKFQASVRCLAPGGKFLEIGKFDLANNNPLQLSLFTENRSFHGVMVDRFFTGLPVKRKILYRLLHDGITSGYIKPLPRVTFKMDEVEQAFRHMAAGKHMGKVVIQLREEEEQRNCLTAHQLFPCVPRYACISTRSYVVSGGLGGFGLELADWLVLRGARKLLLGSRQGLKTGYQALRIKAWQSYGAEVRISTADTTTKEGSRQLLEEAALMGPVHAIFNLAVVLKDAIFENQTAENFDISLKPKAVATKYLDEVSRELCPELRDFVIFSSVSCGRGNAGQTNYGMANSVMERICEERKAAGYPALAIQWGAIGEVGLVAEMQELHTDLEIGGTLQQRIVSCLRVIDTFLRQDEAVVSSMVVAEKRRGAGGADNIVDAVMNIMGLKDLKTVSLHTTLPELGMDSMMAVEIKQTLEREFEVFLTAQDIRNMTFARLKEIAQEKEAENDNKGDEKDMPKGLNVLFRTIGDEEMASVPIVRLPSLIKEKSMAPKTFLLPGVEGMASVLAPLAANLASHAICLQFVYNKDEDTIQEIALNLLPQIEENLSKTSPFTLIAYSFGAVVALELAALLENDGRLGRVIIIDGSPHLFQKLCNDNLVDKSEAVVQTAVILGLMAIVVPPEQVQQYQPELMQCKTFDERMDVAKKYMPEDTPHSESYQRQVCTVSFKRIWAIMNYRSNIPKIKSIVKLFKPTRPIVEGIAADYDLSLLTESPVEVTQFEGNHLTILKNTQVAYTINNIIDSSSTYFKPSLLQEKPTLDGPKEVNIKEM